MTSNGQSMRRCFIEIESLSREATKCAHESTPRGFRAKTSWCDGEWTRDKTDRCGRCWRMTCKRCDRTKDCTAERGCEHTTHRHTHHFTHIHKESTHQQLLGPDKHTRHAEVFARRSFSSAIASSPLSSCALRVSRLSSARTQTTKRN